MVVLCGTVVCIPSAYVSSISRSLYLVLFEDVLPYSGVPAGGGGGIRCPSLPCIYTSREYPRHGCGHLDVLCAAASGPLLACRVLLLVPSFCRSATSSPPSVLSSLSHTAPLSVAFPFLVACAVSFLSEAGRASRR